MKYSSVAIATLFITVSMQSTTSELPHNISATTKRYVSALTNNLNKETTINNILCDFIQDNNKVSQEEASYIISTFCKVGGNINAQYPEYNYDTPLIRATRKNYIEVVKALIDNNADIDCQDEHGRTALLYAVSDKHPKIIDILRTAKADISKEDNYGLKVNDEYMIIHAYWPN